MSYVMNMYTNFMVGLHVVEGAVLFDATPLVLLIPPMKTRPVARLEESSVPVMQGVATSFLCKRRGSERGRRGWLAETNRNKDVINLLSVNGR